MEQEDGSIDVVDREVRAYVNSVVSAVSLPIHFQIHFLLCSLSLWSPTDMYKKHHSWEALVPMNMAAMSSAMMP
jgi:hypothetical protein